MPFREKEPRHLGKLELPFLGRVGKENLPDGYRIDLENVDLWMSDGETWHPYYKIRGEVIVQGVSDGAVVKEINTIPGPDVKNHPYVRKLLKHINPETRNPDFAEYVNLGIGMRDGLW